MVNRKDSITKWTGSEDAAGAQSSFSSGVIAESKPVAPVEAKKEEVKVAAAPVKKVAPTQRAPVRNFKNK